VPEVFTAANRWATIRLARNTGAERQRAPGQQPQAPPARPSSVSCGIAQASVSAAASAASSTAGRGSRRCAHWLEIGVSDPNVGQEAPYPFKRFLLGAQWGYAQGEHLPFPMTSTPARAHALPLSALAQRAIEDALAAVRTSEWVTRVRARPRRCHHRVDTTALLGSVRDGFGQ
jgi:hypothetical protein